MSELQTLRQKIDNLKGRRDQIASDLNKVTDRIEILQEEVLASEDAQRRIQLVAKQTQDQLRYYIETPVTAALSGVFDNPYEFELRFETRRGQTEGDLIFKRNGIEHKNLTFAGGIGAVDVAAYGLQVSGLSMQKSLRQFLLLDEPLRNLKSKSKIYEKRGSLMIAETAHGLGIQHLIVSHIPEQQEGADRIFRVSIDEKGVTNIE
uniref:Uncharacterized protein n=1 Tax=viral metagenome TaxID=1070528 RepID=A0A6M3LF64_9ZZZZ